MSDSSTGAQHMHGCEQDVDDVVRLATAPLDATAVTEALADAVAALPTVVGCSVDVGFAGCARRVAVRGSAAGVTGSPAPGAAPVAVHTVPLLHDRRRLGTLLVALEPHGTASLDQVRRLARVAAGRLDATERAGLHAAAGDALRTDQVLEALSEGVLVQDLDLRCVQVNRAAGRILHVAREDLLGQRVDLVELLGRVAFVRPDGGPLARESSPPALALLTGDPQVGVPVGMRRRSGSLRWLEVTSVPLRGPDGGLRGVVTSFADVTAQRAAEAERRHTHEALEQLAVTDTLTGLANRTLLFDRLGQALARLERQQGSVALLLLDLDTFKQVNDSHGHEAGDRVLVEVAGRLREAARPTDTVARLGGDEFVVLAEGVRTAQDAERLAERFLAALRRPCELPGLPAQVPAASIGVALANRPVRPRQLYRDADVALYRAKETGRDRACVYDDAMRERMHARLAVEERLRLALEAADVEVAYQPVVDLTTGGDVGFEALVRLRGPDGALLAPGAFLDVAEETGLVVDLDRRVLDRVVADVTAGILGADDSRWVALNLSAQSLASRRFVRHAQRLLRAQPEVGRRLQLEVTERTLLAGRGVGRGLRALAGAGAAVGVDDFGTGYSAMAHLQRHDVSFVKIDHSFVARLGDDRRAEAVVRATIDLAHGLDLVVVAEGVETPEQAERLRLMHCDRAQGFLYAPPMPALDLRGRSGRARTA